MKLLIGVVALAILAACEEVPGTVATPAGDLPAATVAAGMPPMGSARLDLDAALLAFQDICLDTLPRFTNAEGILRGQGFAQNAATSTWYDPRRELSVSLVPQDRRPVCSMIFASNEPPTTLGVGIAMHTSALGAGPGDIGVDPVSGASTTTTSGGATMRFEPNVGGRADLHRAVLIAGG